MDALTCVDCNKITEFVTDYSSGDTICTECGLVIADHFIDDSAEWRTFSDDDNNQRSRHRIGAPTNPLLKSGGLATVIEKPKENASSVSKDDFYNLFRTQNLVKNQQEDKIEKAYEEIKRLSEQLELDKSVKYRACEIMSKFDCNKEKRIRQGKMFNALCAAAVSTACRELRFSRTLKEISMVTRGVVLKDINKASKMIKRLLESDQDRTSSVPINTGELVRRFCSKLDIKERETKAIKEAVEKANDYDIRRNPKSVLAAIIFMISHISQTNKRPIREIGSVAEVVESTIKNSVKDMFPYAVKIIPKWYACEEDITKRLNVIISSWDYVKV